MRLIVDEVRRLGDLIARCMTMIFFFFLTNALYIESEPCRWHFYLRNDTRYSINFRYYATDIKLP